MGIINSLFADSEASHPVNVVSVENHVFQLHADELKLIFENDNIKDHYVMVLSIAGAFQKGNSFLLNIFLRYLEARYKRHDVTDWLGKNGDGSELKGFSESNGIWIWSDLFTHIFENGDKVAIVLIDTQEPIDHINIAPMEIDTTFAMSILLSSVQCYNVNQNIQEDDLRRLQLIIAEYEQLIQQQPNEKPFQKLVFIIRDWPNTNQIGYGWNGDKEVERVLAVNKDQTEEIQLMKNRIKSSFEKINGFLLPYPGDRVEDGNFSGDVRQLDPEFRKYVKELAVELLAPEKIIIKTINGQKIRAHEFSQYLHTYLNVFTSVKSPQAPDICGTVAESSPTDIWKKFGKLVNLDIHVDEGLPDEEQKIYANSRNKIKLVITIGIQDDDGNPLNVGPNDLKDKLYFCDFENREKLEKPWQLSDEEDIDIGGNDPHIFVYKYLFCNSIDKASVSKKISVGVNIPGIGDFDTSHYGTNTKNGKSGSEFHSEKSLAIKALHEIDYSKCQNIRIDIGDFEPINSNLGWTSRLSREGPYAEHNNGKCERRFVHISPELSVTGQQEFKNYEIIEYNGIKNDEVNQSSAVWEFQNGSAEKCFDLFKNEQGRKPCAVIGHEFSSDYHVNVWFPPDAKQIHIDGHVWTQDFSYFYRFCPYAIEKPTSDSERGTVTLSLYKFILPVGGLSQYEWKDVIRTVKIKVTDLYENEGTLELIFNDADNFDKPGMK